MHAWIASQRQVIDVMNIRSDRVETGPDGTRREAPEVLDAIQPLLCDRELEPAVNEDRRGRVAMEEVDTEDYRQSSPRSLQRLWGGTVPPAAATGGGLVVVLRRAALGVGGEVDPAVAVVIDAVIASEVVTALARVGKRLATGIGGKVREAIGIVVDIVVTLRPAG
jgi:hypothetical protein